MTAAALKVGLVDDHAVVRTGYRRFLEAAGIAVEFEAGDADNAYAALGRDVRLPVDVLVVDIGLPGRSGLDLTRRIRHRWSDARILMFTMHADANTVTQCLRAGATGFVTKVSDPAVLVDAVRSVAGGVQALSPDVAHHAEAWRPPPATHTTLSTREFDVLQSLLDGHSLEIIAQRMCLSQKTVANYQTSIRQKLGVTTSIELVHWADRHDLRR